VRAPAVPTSDRPARAQDVDSPASVPDPALRVHDLAARAQEDNSLAPVRAPAVPTSDRPARAQDVDSPASVPDPASRVRDLAAPAQDDAGPAVDHPPAPAQAAEDTPGPARHPVLRISRLTARHHGGARSGATTVLRAPHLVLHSGECLAVVGRSGSGKTTLARCLAGLHRDQDGEILLDGTALPRSLRQRSRVQLAAVQYVFQDARAAFDEHRPVLAQVGRTAVRLRGTDEGTALEEATATLASLGLPGGLVRRRPGELSGGELQRAALARALLARPRVLVCDEITSGLDTVTRRGILDLLTALVRDRDDLALVLITHDLDTAALAHRIAVLDAGELVEQGPARRVLTEPRHPFTAALAETIAPSGTYTRA
ncbi:ATP-binding cassette domain-containing protein, partial [Streptomyces sp. NPDC055506]